MASSLRKEAVGYHKVATGGYHRPEKFNAETLFHLTALAIEGYLIAWLEDRNQVPGHHGFRDLVKAIEGVTPLPGDLKKEILILDQYQKLCEWIPIEPRKPVREEIPGLLDLAGRVELFTA